MAPEERPRFKRRMGYMRKVRDLGLFVRVEEHGCEGEGGATEGRNPEGAIRQSEPRPLSSR